MVIWTGWGFLALVVAAVGLGAAASLGRLVSGTPGEIPVFVPPLGFAIAGVANYLLGRRLNRDAVQVLIDPRTREPVHVDRRHTLFFIRVEHWGIALLALAPVSLAFGLVRLIGG